MALGIQPVSSVGYTVSSNVDYSSSPGGFPVTLQTSGTGGLSKFYLGTGIALFRDLSIGINGSYVWGQIQSQKSIYIPPDSNKYNFEEISTSYVGNLYFDYGIQYHKTFSDSSYRRYRLPKYKLVIGGTLNLGVPMHATQDYSARSLGVGGILNTKDTVVYLGNQPGTITFPMMYRAGFSFEKYKHWMVCADVNFAKWSSYQFFGRSDSLKNMLGFSIGASYRFDTSDYAPYFKRTEYRIGARYDNGYLNINGTDIATYGISVGVGFPLAGKLKASKLNITAEYFVRGTTKQDLLREDYFRIILGVTFGDRWFDRYKLR
jgi:hypothetical protein